MVFPLILFVEQYVQESSHPSLIGKIAMKGFLLTLEKPILIPLFGVIKSTMLLFKVSFATSEICIILSVCKKEAFGKISLNSLYSSLGMHPARIIFLCGFCSICSFILFMAFFVTVKPLTEHIFRTIKSASSWLFTILWPSFFNRPAITSSSAWFVEHPCVSKNTLDIFPLKVEIGVII